ncbi:MAG: hypothetical protein EON98_09690 [Chitinophagaceae bacterium]|nr:MAG: hypothetical protein EON98_09690 [Chitinophagaceae bacterium]
MMKALKALIVPLWLITLAAVACMKKAAEELPQVQMRYTNLQNQEVKANEYYHLDIDGNGTVDYTFHTYLVGDPILRHDRKQFLVSSKIETNLLTNENDESPLLYNGDVIRAKWDSYNWFEVSSIVLAEQIIPETGKNTWRGLWKSAKHNFLPVQVLRGGAPYHGWIEISFDTVNQKLVLHKAAISMEANVEVAAGN